MRRFASVLLAFLLCSLAWPAAALAAGAFGDWGAVVVSGDWHAHDGSPTKAFDNARHDVSEALIGIGFSPGNVEQLSDKASDYPDLKQATADSISAALWAVSNRTTSGCLFYITSHGSPEGAVLGDDLLAPGDLNTMLNNACGKRPTVVVISACFSGVFVPALAAPNRFILTAARADRTSFGCSSGDKYPYFDACFLESVPKTHDFPDLARAVQACVAQREKETGAAPPSDPQLSIGKDVKNLPGW